MLMIIRCLPFFFIIGATGLHVLMSYTKMLQDDKVPKWVGFVGPRIAFRVIEFLVYRMMSWESLRDVHVESMGEKAAIVSKELEERFPEEGGASGGVVVLGGGVFGRCDELAEKIVAELEVKAIVASFPGALADSIRAKIDGLAIRLKPTVVVYSCGAHDFFCGQKPENVADAFKLVHAAIREALPETRVLYVASMRTPLHKSLGQEDSVVTLNKLVRENVIDNDGGRSAFFDFDVSADMPPDEAFLVDRHHLSVKSRTVLADALLPVIREQLNKH
eukprot:TRINITY_DN58713_c0_g1_i1.p1 TRINITY_DN58713_c0_g1~~TRINITY_DN58713_c0_g1_i1.p1  ORF type:complete len:276 (+),score=56.65 TRINITY_DN58713_c0_g1_i1:94-921(+)